MSLAQEAQNAQLCEHLIVQNVGAKRGARNLNLSFKSIAQESIIPRDGHTSQLAATSTDAIRAI